MPIKNPPSKLPFLPAAGLICVLAIGLGACSSSSDKPTSSRYSQSQDTAPDRPIDVSLVMDAVPRVETYSRYGNPPSYVVLGKRYQTLQTHQGYRERGIASWYGTKFHGHRTSSGEPYDMYTMSAAHKSLPLPTYARVTNLENGKSVIVKINDRGPFHENRLIDLSYAAATRLNILSKGTGLVEVEAIDPVNLKPRVEKPPVPASQPKVTRAPAARDSGKNTPSLYLQLGAFANRNNAERLQARMSKSLPELLHISEAVSDQKAIYRVRIGPLTSVETADQLTKILAAEGIDSPRVVIDSSGLKNTSLAPTM